jgi:hypothetical protein
MMTMNGVRSGIPIPQTKRVGQARQRKGEEVFTVNEALDSLRFAALNNTIKKKIL